MNWFQWRVIISDRIPDGATAVKAWGVPTLLEAHAVLDAVENIQEHARSKPPPTRRR